MKEPKSVDGRIKWPSKDAEQADLESLGKMLGRGTYKQIALAAWKSPSVKKEPIALMLNCFFLFWKQLCDFKLCWSL